MLQILDLEQKMHYAQAAIIYFPGLKHPSRKELYIPKFKDKSLRSLQDYEYISKLEKEFKFLNQTITTTQSQIALTISPMNDQYRAMVLIIYEISQSNEFGGFTRLCKTLNQHVGYMEVISVDEVSLQKIIEVDPSTGTFRLNCSAYLPVLISQGFALEFAPADVMKINDLITILQIGVNRSNNNIKHKSNIQIKKSNPFFLDQTTVNYSKDKVTDLNQYQLISCIGNNSRNQPVFIDGFNGSTNGYSNVAAFRNAVLIDNESENLQLVHFMHQFLDQSRNQHIDESINSAKLGSITLVNGKNRIDKAILDEFDVIVDIDDIGLNFLQVGHYYPELVCTFIHFLNKIYGSYNKRYDWVSFLDITSSITEHLMQQHRSPDQIQNLTMNDLWSGNSMIDWNEAVNAYAKQQMISNYQEILSPKFFNQSNFHLHINPLGTLGKLLDSTSRVLIDISSLYARDQTNIQIFFMCLAALELHHGWLYLPIPISLTKRSFDTFDKILSNIDLSRLVLFGKLSYAKAAWVQYMDLKLINLVHLSDDVLKGILSRHQIYLPKGIAVNKSKEDNILVLQQDFHYSCFSLERSLDQLRDQSINQWGNSGGSRPSTMLKASKYLLDFSFDELSDGENTDYLLDDLYDQDNIEHKLINGQTRLFVVYHKVLLLTVMKSHVKYEIGELERLLDTFEDLSIYLDVLIDDDMVTHLNQSILSSPDVLTNKPKKQENKGEAKQLDSYQIKRSGIDFIAKIQQQINQLIFEPSKRPLDEKLNFHAMRRKMLEIQESHILLDLIIEITAFVNQQIGLEPNEVELNETSINKSDHQILILNKSIALFALGLDLSASNRVLSGQERMELSRLVGDILHSFETNKIEQISDQMLIDTQSVDSENITLDESLIHDETLVSFELKDQSINESFNENIIQLNKEFIEIDRSNKVIQSQSMHQQKRKISGTDMVKSGIILQPELTQTQENGNAFPQIVFDINQELGSFLPTSKVLDFKPKEIGYWINSLRFDQFILVYYIFYYTTNQNLTIGRSGEFPNDDSIEITYEIIQDVIKELGITLPLNLVSEGSNDPPTVSLLRQILSRRFDGSINSYRMSTYHRFQLQHLMLKNAFQSRPSALNGSMNPEDRIDEKTVSRLISKLLSRANNKLEQLFTHPTMQIIHQHILSMQNSNTYLGINAMIVWLNFKQKNLFDTEDPDYDIYAMIISLFVARFVADPKDTSLTYVPVKWRKILNEHEIKLTKHLLAYDFTVEDINAIGIGIIEYLQYTARIFAQRSIPDAVINMHQNRSIDKSTKYRPINQFDRSDKSDNQGRLNGSKIPTPLIRSKLKDQTIVKNTVKNKSTDSLMDPLNQPKVLPIEYVVSKQTNQNNLPETDHRSIKQNNLSDVRYFVNKENSDEIIKLWQLKQMRSVDQITPEQILARFYLDVFIPLICGDDVASTVYSRLSDFPLMDLIQSINIVGSKTKVSSHIFSEDHRSIMKLWQRHDAGERKHIIELYVNRLLSNTRSFTFTSEFVDELRNKLISKKDQDQEDGNIPSPDNQDDNLDLVDTFDKEKDSID